MIIVSVPENFLVKKDASSLLFTVCARSALLQECMACMRVGTENTQTCHGLQPEAVSEEAVSVGSATGYC